ncbi:hypothetical protein ACFS6H_19800 [Terrimonas rubra]|uniref:Lipoprotein n=1 Tax=Terrimonas rubra TaxID=1035890 RepID=A0ABW6A9D6_9BACT
MRFLTTLLFIFSLASCYPSQVFKTASNNVFLKGNSCVFENDSVKIEYNLWAERGVVSFELYNKLNTPLYIDWKTSAYITSNRSLNYWQDETVKTTITDNSLFLNSNSKSVSKSVKYDRVSIIPPLSVISKSTYNILPKEYHKKTKYSVGHYKPDNTPISFRSYLAISSSEDFKGTVNYIDNSFYVYQVDEVKSKNKKPSPDSFWIIASK